MKVSDASSRWESELSNPPIKPGGFTPELAERIRHNARTGYSEGLQPKRWKTRFTGLAAAGAMSLATVIGTGLVLAHHSTTAALSPNRTTGAQGSSRQPVFLTRPVTIDPPYRTIGPWTMMVLTVENSPQLSVKIKYLGKGTATHVNIQTPDVRFHDLEVGSTGSVMAMIPHGALMKTIEIEITWAANGKRHTIRPTFAVNH